MQRLPCGEADAPMCPSGRSDAAPAVSASFAMSAAEMVWAVAGKASSCGVARAHTGQDACPGRRDERPVAPLARPARVGVGAGAD